MPGVCFHFEPTDRDVYSGRQLDTDAWICAMKQPGDIDKAVVVNTSNLSLAGLDMTFEWDIQSSMPSLDGTVTYLVMETERNDGTSLLDFDHDTDWYVFGPASGWGGAHQGVYLPQSNTNISLHSVHAASIVMFDRHRVINL